MASARIPDSLSSNHPENLARTSHQISWRGVVSGALARSAERFGITVGMCRLHRIWFSRTRPELARYSPGASSKGRYRSDGSDQDMVHSIRTRLKELFKDRQRE